MPISMEQPDLRQGREFGKNWAPLHDASFFLCFAFNI
jgi:hypothetical protein